MLDELPVSHVVIDVFHHHIIMCALKNKAYQCIFISLDRSNCGFLKCFFLCWLTSMPKLEEEGLEMQSLMLALTFCAYPECPACFPRRMPTVMMPSLSWVLKDLKSLHVLCGKLM